MEIIDQRNHLHLHGQRNQIHLSHVKGLPVNIAAVWAHCYFLQEFSPDSLKLSLGLCFLL